MTTYAPATGESRALFTVPIPSGETTARAALARLYALGLGWHPDDDPAEVVTAERYVFTATEAAYARRIMAAVFTYLDDPYAVSLDLHDSGHRVGVTAPRVTDDLIRDLIGRGYRAEVTTTGGNCHAVAVTLTDADETGYAVEILVTDGDAQLPDGRGAFVGLYVRDADAVEILTTDDDAPVAVLADAVRRAAIAYWNGRA